VTDLAQGQDPARSQVGFSTSSPTLSTPVEKRTRPRGATLRPEGAMGFVYFVRGGDFVKIGWSKNPDRRAEQLRTGCPFKTTVIGRLAGTKDDEAALHRAFDWLRTKGEWFRASRPLLVGVRWVTKRNGTVEDLLEWAQAIRRGSPEVEGEIERAKSLRDDLAKATAATEAARAETTKCRESAAAMAREAAAHARALRVEALAAADDGRAAILAHYNALLVALGFPPT
jgi:hypothetical protein